MLNSFSNRPNLQAYTAIRPQQSLDQVNTAAAPMAAQSLQMDFSVEDRAPEQELNAAIWQSIKGPGSQMPAPRSSSQSASPAQAGDPDD
jgi:hypothetical protein